MSNPSEWIPIYQQNFPNYFNQIQAPLPTISTTTTAATTTAPPAAASTAAAAAIPRNNPLSPNQGRISRPMRRRARASRRTPTTLLNTDTTNFRAMVQHFTGGPATDAGSAGLIPPIPNTATLVEPAATRFRAGYADQMQQQLMLMDSMHGGKGGGSGGAPPPGGPSSGNDCWDFDSYLR